MFGGYWWFVRVEVRNSNGTLANKVKRKAKILIFLVKSQNIAVKVKSPDCSNVNASAVVKGVNNVILLVPFSSNVRV